MALISAMTIITSLSLFHLTLAYFFLTNPDAIADQAMVFIIGEAMSMVRLSPRNVFLTNNYMQPHSRAFEVTSPPLAFLAALFIFIGISDLTACSSREEVFVFYWGAQGKPP
jgi:hypothetical protein